MGQISFKVTFNQKKEMELLRLCKEVILLFQCYIVLLML